MEFAAPMAYYAIAFLAVAIAAGLYGLSGLAAGAVLMGGFLFTVFLLLAIVCLLVRRK